MNNRIELRPEQREYVIWLDQKISAARREVEHYQDALHAFVGSLIRWAGAEGDNWQIAPDGSALLAAPKPE